VVVVGVLLARASLKRNLPGDLNVVGRVRRCLRVTCSVDHNVVQLGRQPRGMGQQLVDGDVLPSCSAIGDIVADGVLYIQLPLRLQDQDRHGRELLG